MGKGFLILRLSLFTTPLINRTFWSDPGGGGSVDGSSGDATKVSNKPHKVEVAPKTSGPKRVGQNLKKEPAQHHFEIISAFINKLEILLAKYEKNEKTEDQANCQVGQPVGKKATTLQSKNSEFTKRKSRAEIKKKKSISAPRENIKKVWKLKFDRRLTLSL